MENLLLKGFKPERTIVLTFGADEERGGKVVGLHDLKEAHSFRLSRSQTGKEIGKYLLERYGKDNFSIILDEGGILVPFSKNSIP
jgi:acetylornithine deacetylase/succinyl-diaminopimelate desuccinylase-like protein